MTLLEDRDQRVVPCGDRSPCGKQAPGLEKILLEKLQADDFRVRRSRGGFGAR
jgi:hypothetical protein